jgi:hypothetical protein
VEIWKELLTDVHANDAIAAGFYIFLAIVPIGIPFRFLARLLELLPAAWLTRESTTGLVTFVAWSMCWFATRYEPMLNGAALYGTVTAVLVGPLLKRLMARVDGLAEKSKGGGDA